jgi:hypothetical protein
MPISQQIHGTSEHWNIGTSEHRTSGPPDPRHRVATKSEAGPPAPLFQALPAARVRPAVWQRHRSDLRSGVGTRVTPELLLEHHGLALAAGYSATRLGGAWVRRGDARRPGLARAGAPEPPGASGIGQRPVLR